jgi:SAM-dependent methyltransferase
MGLDAHGTKFLLLAKRAGVSFEKTVTLGRQGLNLPPRILCKLLSDFNIPQYIWDKTGESQASGYAEPLFQLLGADEVCSLDASGYENATHVVDLNSPVSAELINRFTAVVDGGTLEHVFNFPVAIENCMKMLRVGGHFIALTPANNFFGHGFYQFSPELFFRIFSPENGFALEQMVMYEEGPAAMWYVVADPETLGERGTLANSNPTYLAVLAKKLRSGDIFRSPPQQSDYSAMWRNAEAVDQQETRLFDMKGQIGVSLPRRMYHLAPWGLRRAIRVVIREMRGPAPRFFAPFRDPAMRGK